MMDSSRPVGILTLPFLALMFTLGCATTGPSVSKIEVKGFNDPLANNVEVSTRSMNSGGVGGLIKGLTLNRGIFGLTTFLRGFYNKQTKQPVYQLYSRINAGDWRRWSKLRFLADGKLTEVQAKRAGSDVNCSSITCVHQEDVVANLEYVHLKEWAASPEPITVRYSSSIVTEHKDIEVNPREVKHFLHVMDLVESGKIQSDPAFDSDYQIYAIGTPP